MKKYMAVYITCCPGSCIHGAHICYMDEEAGLDLSFDTSYEDGMKALRQLEKALGKTASTRVNYRDRDISYKELHGYIRGE